MIYKQFLSILLLVLLSSCRNDYYQTRIEGTRIEINDSLASIQQIDDFIAPYREHVNSNLDSVLAYAADTYSKSDGDLNTAIGNLMADIVKEQAQPIFEARTGNGIDMVLLNNGGIRAIMSKGNVTTRTAYEIMPFENSIVVVEMKGKLIKDELIPFLIKEQRAHPITGLKLEVDNDFNLMHASIDGNEIKDDHVYHVATIDYLYFGGNNMHFLEKGDSLHVLDYKVRNAMIDYFRKVDTISPVIDDRFIKTN